MADRKPNRLRQTKRLLALLAPIMLVLVDQAQPSGAIFNCFAPNMYKMGKGQHGQAQVSPYANANAERANWYPQAPMAAAYGGYAQHPMRMLFQPKWKSGGLFGNKGWNNWRNNNFYRPGMGGYPAMSSAIPHGAYPINEQLNVAPFALPNPSVSSGYSSALSASSALAGGVDGGWSVPLTINSPQIQQTQLNAYDSYTQLPTARPAKQQTSSLGDGYYGSSKGGGGGGAKYASTKNVLLADGGYSAFDAHLGALKNRTYGYDYPEKYVGAAESPAKIAQQLVKYGLKRQRLERLTHQNRSAALLKPSSEPIVAGTPFTILDEPRFVGFGAVDLLNNREARLRCSFGEPIDQSNRPLWVKFSGPYNSSQMVNGKVLPPFNCAQSQCRTQEIESTKDYRYTFDNGPATSTLIIAEPRLADYGTYRCSALTKAINSNPLETIYQVVQFGDSSKQ